MEKKCEKCNKQFEARQPRHRLCPNCFFPTKRGIEDSLVSNYYDDQGNLLKKVIIDIPQNLANIFEKDGLSIKQLRDFHAKILKARNKAALQKNMSVVKPILYKCQADVTYQLKRKAIPQGFAEFME